MSDHGDSNEQLIDMSGQSAGVVSGRVVELAGVLGYSVVASGPGSYRLARTTRRMLVMKNVESATITVFEDRNGTKVRIVGRVDDGLVEHLTADTQPSAPARPGQVAPAPTPGAASVDERFAAGSGPSPQSAAPAVPAPASPPAPPGGLITTPTWASSNSSPAPPPAAPHPDPFEAPSPLARPTPGPLPDHVDDVDGRTVARSSLAAPGPHTGRPVPREPALALPDGRTVALHAPVVVGRDPDVSRGPVGSEGISYADPSLSKTHATVETGANGVYVTDLHSTNGTSIEAPGAAMSCAPGERTMVPPGSVVRFGDVVASLVGDS